MSFPRAWTADELRDRFLDHCRRWVEYWASPEIDAQSLYRTEMSTKDRLSGLLHSILCELDGVCGDSDCPFDLVAKPHPNDKEYLRKRGTNWTEPDTVISDMLHEFLYHRGIWKE